ncbi:MAG: SRPBCC family protein, partial [Betaproteobacteria bacterium]|nr:SRPBCC family protein [Betaproteobacteria bacterium]
EWLHCNVDAFLSLRRRFRRDCAKTASWSFRSTDNIKFENQQSSDRVGCIRHFHTRDGGMIRERLLALSDYEFACTYEILESPMGVEHYVATLKLTPVTDGDRCFAEWSAEFECAEGRERELSDLIGGEVFQGGFNALKRHFARR